MIVYVSGNKIKECSYHLSVSHLCLFLLIIHWLKIMKVQVYYQCILVEEYNIDNKAGLCMWKWCPEVVVGKSHLRRENNTDSFRINSFYRHIQDLENLIFSNSTNAGICWCGQVCVFPIWMIDVWGCGERFILYYFKWNGIIDIWCTKDTKYFVNLCITVDYFYDFLHVVV